MNAFRYPVWLRMAVGGRTIAMRLWVDTDTLYNLLPAALLQSLGYEADAARRFRQEDGSTIELPVADVPMRIGDETHRVLCVFGDGEAMLLGRLTLAVFGLEVDEEQGR